MAEKNIVIIGAGKVAFSLAAALSKTGLHPSLVISKDLGSAKRLALEGKVISKFSSNLNSILKKPSLILLTVPDSQIGKTARLLARQNLHHKNNTYVHFSGCLDLKPLSALLKKGGNTGSFHIMQTFPSKDIVKIEKAFVGLEYSNPTTKKLLLKLASDLKLRPLEIPAGGKVYYHIAGVFISNFLVSNFAMAEELFKYSGIKGAPAYKVFEPLLLTTVRNIKKYGVMNSFSGPMQRGDEDTLKLHLSALEKRIKDEKTAIKTLLNYLNQTMAIGEFIRMREGPNSDSKVRDLNLIKHLNPLTLFDYILKYP
ncbi:MAG: DUF2520 domain-containing protein [Ignavibacteriales bacterium]|nr:DUF2520 domain-containing protein [Ignavibacteriales bacterium]